MHRMATGLALAFYVLAGQAAPTTVKNLRTWQGPERTRVVLDLSGPVDYTVGVLTDPDRVYLDLPHARLAPGPPSLDGDGRLLAKVRSGRPGPGVLRIVLDLTTAARPEVFQLEPNDVYGDRLVVDLEPRRPYERSDAARPAENAQVFTVAIDAGHGGEDPGAVGRRGTREKTVSMAIARKHKALVDDDPAVQGFLIRRGDYYVALRRRTAIARARGADLFVSVHADSYPKSSARGSSVYTLSTRGASSEAARWLSSRENAADLIGGVSLRDKDENLAKVLWDLSMSRSIRASRGLAGDILHHLGRIGRLHSDRVEYANFAVLKSPDIPSVLVESAFLSNPDEEKLLRSESYKKKVADAIYWGISGYYHRRNPDSRPRVYVVRRGDTLSEIARHYRVGVGALKEANGLTNDGVRAGQALRLPDG